MRTNTQTDVHCQMMDIYGRRHKPPHPHSFITHQLHMELNSTFLRQNNVVHRKLLYFQIANNNKSCVLNVLRCAVLGERYKLRICHFNVLCATILTMTEIHFHSIANSDWQTVQI